MKILTFVVPCYNAKAYMAHAIDSILPGGDDIEIVVVDDGSTDDTLQIAQTYAEKYPDVVRVISQENGGHGEAINTGLTNATGKYFKVVDSDDWLDEDALHKILNVLRRMENAGEEIDLLVSNYIYEKDGARHKKCIQYRNVFPRDRIFTWDKIGNFYLDQYILMHSVIYRTQMLKSSGMHLPAHTFYVDNIYVYYPLPYVQKIYYMDVDLYRYYIGREDQSVNESVMIKRIDQQIYVTKAMIDMYKLDEIPDLKLRQYKTNYLTIMMAISSIFLIRSGDEENLKKKDELWQYLEEKDPDVYQKIRKGFFGRALHMPGKFGLKFDSAAYSVARNFIGFN